MATVNEMAGAASQPWRKMFFLRLNRFHDETASTVAAIAGWFPETTTYRKVTAGNRNGLRARTSGTGTAGPGGLDQARNILAGSTAGTGVLTDVGVRLRGVIRKAPAAG